MLWVKNTGAELAKFKRHYILSGKENSQTRSQRLMITLSTSSGNTIRKPITGQIWCRMTKKKCCGKGSNTERWKAVKGFWDGRSKNNGRSGCGVVVKGADKDKSITISKIAVPLCIGTVTAAEVMGVCVPASWILFRTKVSALKISIIVSTQFLQSNEMVLHGKVEN